MDRDRELEMIVDRLEAETNSNTSDVSRRYRMDIERLKASMAEEIKDVC